MRLSGLKLENFRNYKKSEASTDSDLVLILGDNATGKTNLIEGIYFLSTLKSFRAPDNLLVKHGEDYFKLIGTHDNKKLEAIIQVNPNLKRQFKIDDQKISRLSWDPFRVVLFAPNDLNIFSMGPQLRRKYLNDTLSQYQKSYAADLASLEHLLKQRASLLNNIAKGVGQASQLEFWNNELAFLSLRISSSRREFLNYIRDGFEGVYTSIFGTSAKFEIIYKGLPENITTEGFLQLLADHQEAEIRSGMNLVGPQRDDFIINKDSVLNIYNSSRGELRSQVLAIKLLQAAYLTTAENKPVILLDDVFSELDETRRVRLLQGLATHQIFITSTEEHHLPLLEQEHKIIKVTNGTIEEK